MRVLIALLALPLLAGCETLSHLTGSGGAPTFAEMDDEAFDGYLERTTRKVEIIASAAIEAGDLSPAGARQVAGALRVLARGEALEGGAAALDELDLDGYGAATLLLVLMEIDDNLESRGAYDDGGVLGARGSQALLSIALMLEGLADDAGSSEPLEAS